MKTIFAFCIALLGFTGAYAQPPVPMVYTFLSYTAVQHKPIFAGDINKWLADNIVYPNDAKMNNIQGTVYVRIMIERDGSVSTVKLIRGIQGGKMLDDEAMRVVSMMPAWTPGKQGDSIVRVEYDLPIHFILDDNKTTTPNDSNKVFTIVQQEPIFPGDIKKWLANHVVYGSDRELCYIEGIVYVSFIVERDGSISSITILRGGTTELNNETIRVVSLMPKWSPGHQNGHTVRVAYILPIHFIPQ